MVGKYIEFEDAYKSIIESLKISAAYNRVKLKLKWIQTENLTKRNVANKLKNQAGVIILPGFGKRGFEGKIIVARYTRKHNIATLGICFGFQAMVIAQALEKNILDATSSEVKTNGTFVIDIIRGKNKTDNLGGTLRLGESETVHLPKSLISKIYQNQDSSFERHRHRYEVNPQYLKQLEDNYFIFSGFSKVGKLAEVCEMPNLKFYLGLQAHPEFKANPLLPSPIFQAFIKTLKK